MSRDFAEGLTFHWAGREAAKPTKMGSRPGIHLQIQKGGRRFSYLASNQQ
jgi:hypothetical protein